jgi:hypothetical protein
MRRKMPRIDKNKARWIGGIAIGVAISEIFRGGWGAIVMLFIGGIGKWLFYKFMGIFFDGELEQAKKLRLKDPVKIAIWRHTQAGHAGKWQDCTDAQCAVRTG